MKVLFIANDRAIFEAGSPVRERMRAYANEIGELHILGRASKTVEEEEGALRLHGRSGGVFFALAFFPRLARSLIHTHGIEVVSAQDPFEYGRIAALAREGTKAKLHLQIHTDLFSPWFVRGNMLTALCNSVRLRIADELIPKADGIRVVSKRIQDSLVARYGNALPPTSVLPIPPSLVLPPKEPLPPHPFTFTLVALSRLEEEKRIEDLFHALFKVQRRYPQTGLFVIGAGKMQRQLEEKAKHCCRPESVIFLPWRDDALALLQSASAFVQASAYEGYGRTLIEAALAKVPIVTTDVGIVGEVLRPGEDMLVSPPGDREALAKNIALVIEDERLRLMLPLSAYETAQAHVASYDNQSKRIAEDLARTLTSASLPRR